MILQQLLKGMPYNIQTHFPVTQDIL